jgi:DNA-binding transcriptional MerR regulator
MSEQIDSSIQDLIDTSERLIEEAQQNSFDRLCRDMGIDAERFKAFLAQYDTPETREQAEQAIAEDRLEVEREIEAEMDRRGLRRPAPKARMRGLRI